MKNKMKTTITKDEFLDNEKKRGLTVWKCKTCGARLIGAGLTYHDSSHKVEIEK